MLPILTCTLHLHYDCTELCGFNEKALKWLNTTLKTISTTCYNFYSVLECTLNQRPLPEMLRTPHHAWFYILYPDMAALGPSVSFQLLLALRTLPTDIESV